MKSSIVRRRILGALTALLASAGAALSLGTPATAAGTGYVALGDSYSSGTGTGSYIFDGTSCYRSTYAYPALDAAALGLDLTFRACSGATVADVTNAQLSALSSTTAYVTISVGGNDAGFADVITECAQPGWLSNCNGAIDDAQYIINNVLPSRLSTLYSSIRAKAPNAKVMVVGYPRIFNGTDCDWLTWFSSSEMSRLNSTADLLNAKTAALASDAGFTFVNPTQVFLGHAVCDNPEWINGLKTLIVESYHPNKDGHRYGYAVVTQPAFGSTAVLSGPETLRKARAMAPQLTADAKQYASLDRSIEPRLFQLPDLTTPEARAAAAAAGVDLTSRASIDRMDRIYSEAQAKEWAATH